MFPGLIHSLENKFVLQGFSSRAAALAETDGAAAGQVLGASKAGQKPHVVFFLVAGDEGGSTAGHMLICKGTTGTSGSNISECFW